MELHSATKSGIDISTEREVLRYHYTGARPIEVLCRVDLGDADNPIVGGDDYTFHVYLNDVEVMPVSSVPVSSGADRAIFISRVIAMRSDDEIVVKVVGLGGDTNIDSVATLRDTTPVQASQILGSGAVLVDHNYGGDDNLRFVDAATGAGIASAEIQVFWKEDYDAGRRSNDYVTARMTTTAGGRWAQALSLEPGSYVLVFNKPGAYQPAVVDVTVA